MWLLQMSGYELRLFNYRYTDFFYDIFRDILRHLVNVIVLAGVFL